ERLEEQTKTISLKLLELSGSGFVISGSEDIKSNDLLRIKCGGYPGILEKKVARAVRTHSRYANFKFLKLPPGDLDVLLRYITSRISTTDFLKKTGESTLTHD
ncbi:MAG: hypothetical protein O2954_19130, partial [bacterium]|nr:hypothetical protein [bacterium]